MKSPVASRMTLQSVQLEDGLMAYRCPESGGHYIPATAYMEWLSKQPARLPQQPPTQEEQPVECSASQNAYLCPETSTIMTRYKVGHGFKFTIDRSITGGIWLDSGEWEALHSRNFHDEIHFVFTEPWQRKILLDTNASSVRIRLKERIGKDLLHRLDLLRDELESNPHRTEIIAYLTKG